MYNLNFTFLLPKTNFNTLVFIKADKDILLVQKSTMRQAQKIYLINSFKTEVFSVKPPLNIFIY